MYWVARLEDKTSHHFMNVMIQDCPYEEAERLAQRQNLKFAEDYSRALYELKSITRYKNNGDLAE